MCKLYIYRHFKTSSYLGSYFYFYSIWDNDKIILLSTHTTRCGAGSILGGGEIFCQCTSLSNQHRVDLGSH